MNSIQKPAPLKVRSISRLIYGNEKGIVLVVSLVFMAVLGMLGTTAVVVTTTDMKIGGNYKTAKESFYDAEAGVQYAIARIQSELADPDNPLSLSGTSVPLGYDAPAGSGFSFDTIATLTQVAGTTNKYILQATGRSGNASSTVEVIIVRDSLFQYGAFGDTLVDIKNSGKVYSYDSRNEENQPGDDGFESTGEGDVGSNGTVEVKNFAFIDGDVGLGDDGEDTAAEAVYDAQGTPTITGDIGDVDRVDPDPLGAVGGSLATDFDTASTANDNDSAGITDNEILLNNGESLILTAGNYYLTSILLHNGSTLTINADDGPVNIYLTGSLDAHNGAAINVTTGNPPDFTIFSNSDANINFFHGSTFKGTVYAPRAKVEMKHSADVYGMIWANEVDIKNSVELYFDTALKDKWLDDTLSIVSWKEIL